MGRKVTAAAAAADESLRCALVLLQPAAPRKDLVARGRVLLFWERLLESER